eukprot:GHVN01076519.1.p1 GENE.GHVN01076519.1~~GHVN01076519.1.p1  ORF type:complete len:125 (+),score=20.95 GHVN01076519.1:149-523(+)
MAGKGSPAYIQQLVKAEQESDAIVQRARGNRVKKIKEAKTAAEEELKAFRQKEEERYKKEKQEKLGNPDDGAKKLDEITETEMAQVKKDFAANKDQAHKFVVTNSLKTDLSLTSVALRSLQTEA